MSHFKPMENFRTWHHSSYMWTWVVSHLGITCLVSRWEHGVQLIISQWSVTLVQLSLQRVGLKLLWCHGHEMSWCWRGHRHGFLPRWGGSTRGESSRGHTGWRHTTRGHWWGQTSRGHTRGCGSTGCHGTGCHGAGSASTHGCLIPAGFPLAGAGCGSLLDEVSTTVRTGCLSPTTAVPRGLCNHKELHVKHKVNIVFKLYLMTLFC